MKIDKNTTFILELFVVGTNGEPVTGLSNTYTIYRSSDDVVIDTGSLSDTGNGTYKNSYLFSDLGQFYILYSTPSGYTDEIETIFVVLESAKSNEIDRILGLSDENKKILDTVHDSNGNMTSAVIKTYPSATDFENNTNLLASYIFNATYDSNGLMQTMGIKRTA